MRRGRHPRRSYNADGTEIVPMTLANMRSHGVRSVLAWRNESGHHADFNADHLLDDLPVLDVALRRNSYFPKCRRRT